ncbi:hypothetical protein [Streptomyces sp. NPDC048650]|uniref:hypothetical protein n=1 Tax=unclassified Streptomyces TaxID=2593676 RepID=UPI00371C1703
MTRRRALRAATAALALAPLIVAPTAQATGTPVPTRGRHPVASCQDVPDMGAVTIELLGLPGNSVDWRVSRS